MCQQRAGRGFRSQGKQYYFLREAALGMWAAGMSGGRTESLASDGQALSSPDALTLGPTAHASADSIK